MRIPIWDTVWLFGTGALGFNALLPLVRMLWLGGDFGSGKTVTATYLAALLMKRGLAARCISNLDIAGASPVVEYVPEGMSYTSPYLEDRYGKKRVFSAGEKLPTEDTAIILDEAALFLEDWASAKNYVGALRKTNLYFLMPSRWQPAYRVKAFEVRRIRNWYSLGFPAWQYDYYYSSGRSVADKQTFFLWRPDRLFGICRTFGYPTDDGGILEQLEYTFHVEKVDQFKHERDIRRAVTKIDFGLGTIGSQIAGVVGDMAEQAAEQQAWTSEVDRGRRNGKRR